MNLNNIDIADNNVKRLVVDYNESYIRATQFHAKTLDNTLK